PFGQYWNGSQCIAGQNLPGGNYHSYYGPINISDTDAAEDIVEVFTGQWFCYGWGGYCPNYNQGWVQVVTFDQISAQVQLNIGGYNQGSVTFWGQGKLQTINNDSGSQISMLVYN